ncbi:hypothetical protein L1887_07531 [Cichorium endivia]|nr:hypothetical protein L1887_07531 [Cichorium endivia]
MKLCVIWEVFFKDLNSVTCEDLRSLYLDFRIRFPRSRGEYEDLEIYLPNSQVGDPSTLSVGNLSQDPQTKGYFDKKFLKDLSCMLVISQKILRLNGQNAIVSSNVCCILWSYPIKV